MVWRDELLAGGAVAAGGVVGATARWAVGTQLAADSPGDFPWATFVVNVLGCLLIGLASTRIARPSLAWSFAATGMLGGFTTMSSFAVELNDLADAGANRTLIVYLAATLVAGFGALLLAETSRGPVDDLAEGPEVVG
ncbi:fluoride efflux transporter FluC [Ilumatobacter nonamiensis]|uniref:fluoride efflux transporter FluC n=1 Tax=Ilumatobacter nonamiensis TaxID=467093 RepID=UPI0003456949|nr:CrcB family protein [Ilumatobacter nonamiensis]